MEINSLQKPPGPDEFYDEKFLNVIDTYRTYLTKHPDTNVITITPHLAVKREFDFYGLCEDLNITPRFRKVIMILNNIACNTDYNRNINMLYVPSFTLIEQFLQIHNME